MTNLLGYGGKRRVITIRFCKNNSSEYKRENDSAVFDYQQARPSWQNYVEDPSDEKIIDIECRPFTMHLWLFSSANVFYRIYL